MSTTGAIVVGGHVNGLGLVRALAARGIPVAVIQTKPYDMAHRSRFCVAHEAAFDVEDRPEQLTDVLERRRREWAGWAVFPAGDGPLAALARHHERLSASYRVMASPWEVAHRLLDKHATLEAARALGVELPLGYGPAVPAATARAELRFPVLVKPNVSHPFFARFGRKVFVARDRAELGVAIARLAGAGIEGELFDVIPGGDDHIYAYCVYMDAGGEPRGGVTIRKLRQSPPLFGVSRVAEVVDDVPALRDATIAIARRLGHRGAAAAEFKLDPRDGRFRFIEINARSVIYNALLRRAGLDLAGLAWSEHMLGEQPAARLTGWRGVWIHLHSDVLYSVLYDRLGAGEMLAPYRRPKVYAVWSASDPAPFAAEWAYTARVAAMALRDGSLRELLADRTRPPSTHSR